jgi:hypothetical protein
MKKLFALIALVLVAMSIWYIFHKNSAGQNTTTIINSNPIVNGHPDPSNATFTFDDGPVTLKKGTNTTSVSDEEDVKIETDLDDTIGYGDLNADGKEDAAVILVQSGGGSGTFFHVAAYVSGPVSYKGTNAVFIGDRILVKSISVRKNKITVDYLDRDDNEPLAAEPTVETSKTYTYSALDNSLSE